MNVATHETADQKAMRLVRNGRVRELPARVFVVAGDTGNRYVVIPENRDFPPRCDCPAWSGCSHLAAANAVLLAEQEEPQSVGAPAARDQEERTLDRNTD